MKKKVLFIDRDGTLVIEPPIDYQLDAFEKLEFYPKVFRNLHFIRQKLDFEFVMVTNQDGLGTSSFPENTFWPVHNLVMKTFANEGITFDEVFIDRSFPEDNAPTRKPRTGMLTRYLNNEEYDLNGSFVIGDRATDVELAYNLGCKAILLQKDYSLLTDKKLQDCCVLATTDWDKVAEFLFAGERIAEVRRTTKETDIYIRLNLDGNGTCEISTGLGFFDHMLEQIGKHGGIDLTIRVKGDLEVMNITPLKIRPLLWENVCIKLWAVKEVLKDTAIACLWMTVCVRLLSISEAVPGWYGMQNSNVRRLAKCLPKCFSISSSR